MKKTTWIIGLSLAFASFPGTGGLITGNPAAAQATSQPSSLTTPVRGPAMIVERLRSAVAKLDLTADQKSMIDPFLQQAAADGAQLAEQLKDEDIQDRLPKVMAFGKSVRDKVEAELTDDQKQTLEKNLQSPSQGNGIAGGRLQQVLAQLDLTPDQQAEIKQIFQENRQKMEQIRQNASGAALQTQMQQLRQETRQRLGDILQPEQLAKLQELMQQNRDEATGTKAGASTASPKLDDASSTDSSDQKPATSDNKPADLQSTGPDVGDTPPAIKLDLSGRTFDPTAYKGRVVVLEFGSLSCPAFRDQAPAIDKLKSAESGRAFFVLVYTKEAFPAGKTNVERNQTEGCDLAQPTTTDERKALAAQAVERLHIDLPVAVDTMDDAAAKAYGLLPNGCVIIGKDGKIAARQKWTNADSLRRAIDDANGTAVAGQ
jgi:Spy/CpxP family protein refolding chaperone